MEYRPAHVPPHHLLILLRHAVGGPLGRPRGSLLLVVLDASNPSRIQRPLGVKCATLCPHRRCALLRRQYRDGSRRERYGRAGDTAPDGGSKYQGLWSLRAGSRQRRSEMGETGAGVPGENAVLRVSSSPIEAWIGLNTQCSAAEPQAATTPERLTSAKKNRIREGKRDGGNSRSR